MGEPFGILITVAKALAVWIVPFAVAAYVVTYFVMAIIFMTFWKQEHGPWMRHFWKKVGPEEPRELGSLLADDRNRHA